MDQELQDSDFAALRAREAEHAGSLPAFLPDAGRRRGDGSRREVVLVGAGAVSLMTAWQLVREGFAVTVLDAGPDPRTLPDWRQMGCTFSGYGARVFSLTEARQHHASAPAQAGNKAYRQAVDEGGWRCLPDEDMSAADRAWIATHERIPGWLLEQYGHTIEAFNVESAPLWQAMRELEPDVFAASTFCPRLVRTYLDAAGLERAGEREAGLGWPAREMSADQVRRQMPALAAAVDSGEIYGALSVHGFSVDIHAFGRNLIDALARAGVAFHWSTRIEAIDHDDSGRVRGLVGSHGPVRAESYVLSPGAFGNGLLAGTASADTIAAVVGTWVSILNDAPTLDCPLKIARRGFGASGPAQGANVIPVVDADGRGRLHVSSGHGFLGLRPQALSERFVDMLGETARDTARRYFPGQSRRSGGEANLQASLRYCIRPWTPTGLGLFESVPTVGGGALIVAAGHNTGGFAQAPAIARAVAATLNGAPHPMQTLYHPRRFASFVETAPGAVPASDVAE